MEIVNATAFGTEGEVDYSVTSKPPDDELWSQEGSMTSGERISVTPGGNSPWTVQFTVTEGKGTDPWTGSRKVESPTSTVTLEPDGSSFRIVVS